MAEIMTEEKEKRSFKDIIAAAFTKESIAKGVFTAFAAFSILAVFAIIFYILYDSIPAFREIGFFNFIFGDIWNPKAGEYGILPMILTTLLLTVLSVVIGSVFAIFTAVFIVYYCPKCIKKVYTQMVNLLAGIPSIIYAYFGFEMICQGKFTTAQIDKNTWTEEMLDMLLDWIKTDPRGEEYRDLDWSKEYDLARNGDPNDTQTAL